MSPKSYKFKGLGDIHGPKPYTFISRLEHVWFFGVGTPSNNNIKTLGQKTTSASL